MSLVNLAHACSHLQNASLARLGLTSIPYTRLHLSLSLLLHKQGFLSHVKLAGPSPPASCFPPGARDNVSSISDQSSIFGPEGALQRAVAGVTAEGLRREGFGEEAIGFAMEERMKSKAQLEREGWDDVVAKFLLRHDGKSWERLEAEGMSEESIAVLEQHQNLLEEAKEEVRRWHPDDPPTVERDGAEEPEEQYEARCRAARIAHTRFLQNQRHTQLLRQGFPLTMLQFFAGAQNSLRSERDLARDGLTLHSMGQRLENQPYNPPPLPTDTDPYHHETEGIVTQANRASRRLWLGLKYWDGVPVLRHARMLSKPTKRIWLDSRELNGLVRGKAAARGEIRPLTRVGEVMAVSTDLGVLEARECAERNVGGMALCRVS